MAKKKSTPKKSTLKKIPANSKTRAPVISKSKSKKPATAKSKDTIPAAYRDYACDEYFAKYAAKGFLHPRKRYWFVEKAKGLTELTNEDTGESLDFLSIGGPGVDGITWGYRKQEPGIWSWNPIDGEFRKLADSIDQLLKQWDAGTIKV